MPKMAIFKNQKISSNKPIAFKFSFGVVKISDETGEQLAVREFLKTREPKMARKLKSKLSSYFFL